MLTLTIPRNKKWAQPIQCLRVPNACSKVLPLTVMIELKQSVRFTQYVWQASFEPGLYAMELDCPVHGDGQLNGECCKPGSYCGRRCGREVNGGLDDARSEHNVGKWIGDANTQDPHRMVQCASHPDVLWVQHHCGIYRSSNGGIFWTAIAAPVPSGFGFAVAGDPTDPLRAWFAPAQADSHRYPVDAKMVVTRTDDGGATFRVLDNGLPERDAYHLVYRHSMELASDGHTLALSSTTGGLWISSDQGEHWHCVSRDLPPVAALSWVATD